MCIIMGSMGGGRGKGRVVITMEAGRGLHVLW